MTEIYTVPYFDVSTREGQILIFPPILFFQLRVFLKEISQFLDILLMKNTKENYTDLNYLAINSISIITLGFKIYFFTSLNYNPL